MKLILSLLFMISMNMVFAITGVSYVAVGTTDSVLTSLDGVHWNYVDLSKQFHDKNFKGVAFGNNKWVTVGDYSIATSSDGDTWENHSLSSKEFIGLNSVVFYNGAFYAGGSANSI